MLPGHPCSTSLPVDLKNCTHCIKALYSVQDRLSFPYEGVFVLLSLMQRRYSEPNTYTDSPPSDPQTCDDIYDDVASIDNEQEVGKKRPTLHTAVFILSQSLHLSNLPEII